MNKVVLFLTFVIASFALFAAVLHVPEDFITIQSALDSVSEGDTVMVAVGIYYESIIWPEVNGVKLLGSGEEDTIIEGDANQRVISFMGESPIDRSTLIEGFTIRNGNGGIYFYDSSPTLRDMIITNNSAESGGGLYCFQYSNVLMEDSKIIKNSAMYYGGGIVGDFSSDIELISVIMKNNTANYGGGALEFDGGGSVKAKNCLIAFNSAGNCGGGVYIGEKGVGHFINCTIVNNTAIEDGGAIYGYVYAKNSIIWNNSPNQLTTTSSAIYSDIEDGWEGIGNIQANPMFADEEAENFQLTSVSPCANTGTPDTTGLDLPEIDLLGNPRIYNGRIDMGCYEYQGTAVPEEFSIQNSSFEINIYPNPLNLAESSRSGKSFIKLFIPHDGNIELAVFNIKGQRIKTIFTGDYKSGEHILEWNGKDDRGITVTSGIYFYRLICENEYKSSAKVVIVK